MSKRSKKEYNLPMMSDLQAIARMPARVWIIARLALLIWAAAWVIGAVIRLFTTFHLIRVNRDDSGDKSNIKTIRPVYALFNINITGKASGKDSQTEYK